MVLRYDLQTRWERSNGERLRHQANGSFLDFLLDEKDGILIDMRLMGNVLYDFYEVNGMFFTSQLSKEKKGLYFELMGGMKSDFRKSSTGISEITEVYAYPPAFVQRVQLKKIN